MARVGLNCLLSYRRAIKTQINDQEISWSMGKWKRTVGKYFIEMRCIYKHQTITYTSHSPGHAYLAILPSPERCEYEYRYHENRLHGPRDFIEPQNNLKVIVGKNLWTNYDAWIEVLDLCDKYNWII